MKKSVLRFGLVGLLVECRRMGLSDREVGNAERIYLHTQEKYLRDHAYTSERPLKDGSVFVSAREKAYVVARSYMRMTIDKAQKKDGEQKI